MKKIVFNDNKNIVGEKLKQLRVMRKLSQQQVAAKLQTLGVNIDQQMISKIENNTRQITDYEFACFCLVLQATPNEVLAEFFEKYSE